MYVDQDEVDERACAEACCACLRCMLLRVYSSCVALRGMLLARVLPSGALGFFLLVYFFELLDAGECLEQS